VDRSVAWLMNLSLAAHRFMHPANQAIVACGATHSGGGRLWANPADGDSELGKKPQARETDRCCCLRERVVTPAALGEGRVVLNP